MAASYSNLVSPRLTCAAITTALLGLLAAPANAEPVTLTDAVYSYGYTTLHPPGVTFISRRPISPEISPSVLSEFFDASRPGASIIGSYGVLATSNLDHVHAALQITAPPRPIGGDAFVSMELDASTTYQVVVNVKPDRIPPEDIKKVPIIVQATGSVVCGQGAKIASALVRIDEIPEPELPSLPSSAICGPNLPNASFRFNTTDFFPIGVPRNVGKSVGGVLSLTARDGNSESGSFDATVDPTIEIDPSFPYADDFQLDFSPGVSEGSSSDAIPEPSSLALLAAAFTALAIVRRRTVPVSGLQREPLIA
jgi:hypothetical protein